MTHAIHKNKRCSFTSTVLLASSIWKERHKFNDLNKLSVKWVQSESDSCSVMSNSLQPHGLYRWYNIPHGILQIRILEWVVCPFSRGSSHSKDQTQVSCIAGRFFTSWAKREAQEYWSEYPIPSPADLPVPGIERGSPALQVGSLSTELLRKPQGSSRGK